MEIIECHSVFIGNDSGPAYISSYLRVPTFIIFGPTNPTFHVPYGKYHESIQKNIWCTPVGNEKFCYTDGGKRGCASFECMKQLTIEEVKIKLLKFLEMLEIPAIVSARPSLFMLGNGFAFSKTEYGFT